MSQKIMHAHATFIILYYFIFIFNTKV